MKIIRSTKSSLSFATPSKRAELSRVLTEYGRVVNYFIDKFWLNPVSKSKLLKDIVNEPETWLSARARPVAAREALDMCASVKNRGDKTKPKHAGKRRACSSTLSELLPAKRAKGFDCWLHLASIGDKVILDGHKDNADVQASQNILSRFLTGSYGTGCKPLNRISNGRI